MLELEQIIKLNFQNFIYEKITKTLEIMYNHVKKSIKRIYQKMERVFTLKDISFWNFFQHSLAQTPMRIKLMCLESGGILVFRRLQQIALACLPVDLGCYALFRYKAFHNTRVVIFNEKGVYWFDVQYFVVVRC